MCSGVRVCKWVCELMCECATGGEYIWDSVCVRASMSVVFVCDIVYIFVGKCVVYVCVCMVVCGYECITMLIYVYMSVCM